MMMMMIYKTISMYVVVKNNPLVTKIKLLFFLPHEVSG